VEDYGIKSVASKDGNLNRFMHFCGVQFQMVRTPSSSTPK